MLFRSVYQSRYGVQTEINYEVEFSLADTEFAVITSGGLTNSRFYTYTHESLNTIALAAGLVPYTAGDLDVRIKSSLGTNDDVVAYSNVVTITVTPYPTDLPKLAVAGNHQGWNAGNAPLIAASDFGRTDFEGYVWLDGEFKFVAQSADGTFNFPPDSRRESILFWRRPTEQQTHHREHLQALEANTITSRAHRPQAYPQCTNMATTTQS